VLVFVICAALRLARFNVALDATDKPAWHAGFFVGVPAPAAAIVVMLPLYLELVGVPRGFLTAPLVLIYMIAIGFLMVSRVPTWSGKLIGRRIARDLVAPLFVGGVLVVAFLVSFPWETMTALSLVYLGCIPLSLISYRRHARQAAIGTDAPPQS
jgi:CDP-diacylglycerol--serine O-phosphatidyltransferase